MAFGKLLCSVIAIGLCFGNSVSAGIIPHGLQSDVSQATLDSWGWTEIHRSDSTTYSSEAAIVAAATGDHLMMGVWDKTAQKYSILGAGATNVVTDITYQDHNDDDNGNFNPNWSNGLNFYRTADNGSWGFTISGVTDLYSADNFLRNGFQTGHGNFEGPLSRGLSFHTSSGNLTYGWAFNVTGYDYTSLNANFERVFFTTNSQSLGSLPEPASLLMWSGLGVGLLFSRRRKRS